MDTVRLRGVGFDFIPVIFLRKFPDAKFSLFAKENRSIFLSCLNVFEDFLCHITYFWSHLFWHYFRWIIHLLETWVVADGMRWKCCLCNLKPTSFHSKRLFLKHLSWNLSLSKMCLCLGKEVGYSNLIELWGRIPFFHFISAEYVWAGTTNLYCVRLSHVRRVLQ